MPRTNPARASISIPADFDVTKPNASTILAGNRSQDRLERIANKSNPNSRPTTARRANEAASNHSASPNTQAPAVPGQPHSPTSPNSPVFTSLPPYPASPGSSSSRHGREPSRNFFLNFKASKSNTKMPQGEPTIRKVPQESAQPADSPKVPGRTKSTPDLRGAAAGEPVPDLPKLDKEDSGSSTYNSTTQPYAIPRRPVGTSGSSGRPNASPSLGPTTSPVGSDPPEGKKNTRLFPGFMKRNYSSKNEEAVRLPTPPNRGNEGAPSKPRSRDNSATRNGEADNNHLAVKSHLKDQRSMSFKDGTGSTLFRDFKSHTAKAAKDIGKVGKGFFKGRHASNPQPIDPSSYEIRVINQPLREQTRITRISKRLEDSRDKTEFWMPALPWRCIDFLNFNGIEIEGLYRVPGSEREVKIWKARFDQMHDINLFEIEDLYDVNTIGSLFKSWLRDLPEDVLPQHLQESLCAKYAGEEKAPEEVKEVLSQLPPWNYYLLFAITCHLSLLNEHADKNKMTFHNLFVCFAPALRLNGDCFRWLVGDWRSCWKGCATEREALKDEYRILGGGNPDLMPPQTPPESSSAVHDSPKRNTEPASKPKESGPKAKEPASKPKEKLSKPKEQSSRSKESSSRSKEPRKKPDLAIQPSGSSVRSETASEQQSPFKQQQRADSRQQSRSDSRQTESRSESRRSENRQEPRRNEARNESRGNERRNDSRQGEDRAAGRSESKNREPPQGEDRGEPRRDNGTSESRQESSRNRSRDGSSRSGSNPAKSRTEPQQSTIPKDPPRLDAWTGPYTTSERNGKQAEGSRSEFDFDLDTSAPKGATEKVQLGGWDDDDDEPSHPRTPRTPRTKGSHHNRTPSQLPEFDFPQPISPTFTSKP